MATLTTSVGSVLDYGLHDPNPFINARAVTSLGCLTILVYDYVLTLPYEVDLVWSNEKWTGIGTALFILNRYLPFIDTILHCYTIIFVRGFEDCVKNGRAVSGLTSVGIFVSEVILMLRTLALWNGNGWIATILVTAFIATTTGGFIFSAHWSKSIVWYPGDGLGMQACKVAYSNNAVVYVFLLILVMETIIVSLTALRARYHLKSSNAGWVMRLYRQGFVFYLYMLAISLLNVVWPLIRVGAASQSYNSVIFIGLQRVLHSIFCNRVFFIVFKRRSRSKSMAPRRFSRCASDHQETHTMGVGMIETIAIPASQWLRESYSDDGVSTDVVDLESSGRTESECGSSISSDELHSKCDL